MITGNLRCASRIKASLLACIVLLTAGCNDGGVGKTYPVSGTVTLNGAPLIVKSGVVQFKPNADKGNTSPHEPAGSIDSDGRYTLLTKTQKGAPPGWYKILVTGLDVEPAAAATKSLTHRPVPKSAVPAKYGQEKTTILEVEVVENPASGSYDLKLSN